MTDQERVLRDFLTLTWWVDVPGACILLKDKRRSGTEVRELVNLREAARRALSASPPSATAAPCGCRESTPADRLHPSFYPCPEHTARATAAPDEEEKCPECGVSLAPHPVKGTPRVHGDGCPGRAPSRGEVGT